MALIKWDDRLSVGVHTMDEQHKGLVQILNELHEAMIKGAAKEVTGSQIEKLLKYTKEHFAAEEALLRRARYPDLDDQHDKHAALTRQVEDFLARFQKGEIGLSVHLLDFLRNWLSQHIQREDRDYGPWLNQQGLS